MKIFAVHVEMVIKALKGTRGHIKCASAAGQTFIGGGGRSRQAQAAGVDESLIAWGWCAVDFLAHVSGFFTDDVVGWQKTYTLFSGRHKYEL